MKARTIRIRQDIKPVSELKARTREVLEQAHLTGRPIVITVKGRPAAVIMDAEEYEKQQRALDLAGLIAEAEEDVREGRLRAADDVMAGLERAAKLRR